MHDPPVAFFLTWTTYGSWLPGDDRWWTESYRGKHPPNFQLRKQSQSRMTESALTLAPDQRILVATTIAEHCTFRSLHLWTRNVGTNHVHVVVTSAEHPDKIVGQFKAWCTRKLKELASHEQAGYVREKWWTEGASTIYLNDQEDLEGAVIYVRDCQ